MAEYISVGSDCSVAYQLQKFGYRNKAYPFDWIHTKKLRKLIELIDNDFDIFTDLKVKNYSENFPYLNTGIWTLDKLGTTRVTNIKYKIDFVHDFKTSHINTEIDHVKQKYNRRIKRFYEIMKDETKKKILIRTGSQKEDIYIKLLEQCLLKKGCCNFRISFLPFENIPISIDWKKDSFDWKDYFESIIK